MSAVLEKLGVPVDTLITLDLESFYSKDFGLKKYTTEAYVRDAQFELLGVGVKVGDGPSVWMEESEFAEWAGYVPWERVAILAHNTAFDGLAFSHHYGIHAGFYLDTLSMGRAVHGIEVGGSLAALSEHYAIGEKGHEVLNALGKHRADFTPDEWAAYGNYCVNDVELTYKLFWKLLPQLPELELWVIDTTLRCFIEPILELDADLTRRALEFEVKKKADLLARINADRASLMSNDKFAALLLELGEDPPMKVSEKKTASARRKDPDAGEVWVPALAKNDSGFKALLEHERDEVRWLAEARIGVKSTGAQTRAERFLAIAERGALPVFLKYHGAHTGRWAAGDKTNFQNLERVDKRNPDSGALRRALLAPEGRSIVVVDSSQVEARVIAWLAGHEKLLVIFRSGADLYSEMGTEFFGRKVTKETPTDRQIAKNMVLGLGFGMGWAKFSGELLKGMLGSKPHQFTMKDAAAMRVDVEAFVGKPKNAKKIASIPTRLSRADMAVHCAVAAEFVNIYREKNAPITALWQTMEAAIWAMEAGDRADFGHFRVIPNGIVLPSGRTLHYPDLQNDGRGQFTYRGKRGSGPKSMTKIYGGLLTENVVQAIARDVVAEEMLHIRAEGFRLAMTTHDEAASIARNEDAERALAVSLAAFKLAPDWAPGLPLSAEGGFNRSYGAAK